MKKSTIPFTPKGPLNTLDDILRCSDIVQLRYNCALYRAALGCAVQDLTVIRNQFTPEVKESDIAMPMLGFAVSILEGMKDE